MSLKLAIHDHSNSFSDIWIDYCIHNGVNYKIVNCFSNSIISDMHDCYGLMWHWFHNDYRAHNAALQIVLALETAGKYVFPNSNTCWHYDDKVAQKYLLEAISAPLVPTYIFHSAAEAYQWIETTTFPKVFKLRCGAGSQNVQLVRSREEANRIVRKAFQTGFPYYSSASDMRERIWTFRRIKSKAAINHLIKGIVRIAFKKRSVELLPQQKGYVYFQDFLSENKHDVRVRIIGNKASATIRYNRGNDFRASGSRIKSYDHSLVEKEYLEIAFTISDRLRLQSCAFDFLKHNGKIFLIEISYCFGKRQQTGYWDRNFTWHDQKHSPEIGMIENFLQECGVVVALRS